MNGESLNLTLHLIASLSAFLLVLGFITFLFLISPEFRKILKRNKKLKKRINNIKQSSKTKDFQI